MTIQSQPGDQNLSEHDQLHISVVRVSATTAQVNGEAKLGKDVV